MKKTPWFDAHVKPIRRGVYEQKPFMWKQRFCYWNGRNWMEPSPSLHTADESGRFRSGPRPWRGLIKE